MLIEKQLLQLGFTEKQAKIYLACLELGRGTVTELSQKTKIKRSTTFVILQELLDKGLSSSSQIGSKTVYVAEDPALILSSLEIQNIEIKEKMHIAKDIISQLKALDNSSGKKPMFRYFSGKEGLKTIINEELFEKRSKSARSIFPVDEVEKIFTDKELRQIGKLRKSLGYKTKTIYIAKSENLPSNKTDERIKLPYNKYKDLLKSDIYLFDNKIRFASFDKQVGGFVLENADLYNTLCVLFDLAWKASKNEKDK